MSLKRGALIVIEGVDRSGKSTQCKKLVKSLQNRGIKAKLMNFPDRSTHTGGLINKYLTDKSCSLNDKAIHLLFSANRWESYDRMNDLLNQGFTLIVDRYSYSGIAFSSVKKHMDINWCKQPEIGLLKPDLVLLLTLSDEEMLKRPGFGEERYENINIQKSVKEVFNNLAYNEDNWKVMDAGGTIEDVHEKLLIEVLNKLKEVETSPLQHLNFYNKKLI
ncbi:thymidylate kinase [Coccinella septempunctata]|uniref:thymidylate kinase n=1 Tax=Coccinella septempunctata TaxID=41139 RepID=UPI001D05C909|nr:thymidylate kinase [Coccinella septempunctata]